jgi:orotate phosphoribosyltransferase
LHIADLITEASSYERAWVPALAGIGGSIASTIAVVNRCQGGFEKLRGMGIEPTALVDFDDKLFEEAAQGGVITDAQKQMLTDYMANPEATVKAFLAEHPDFLKKTIAAAGKDAPRAKLCIEKKYYA